jgi:hypothetical protein
VIWWGFAFAWRTWQAVAEIAEKLDRTESGTKTRAYILRVAFGRLGADRRTLDGDAKTAPEAGRLCRAGAKGEAEMIKLIWVDIGLATEPGQYESRYGLIEVTADDLWVWQKYPNTAFVVMQPSPFSDETVCRLGTFELREDWNVPGREKVEPEPSEASVSDQEIDDVKDQQTEKLPPFTPEASDLTHLDDAPLAEVSAVEPAEETKIGPLDSVEKLNDLKRRVDALINGSDQTSGG